MLITRLNVAPFIATLGTLYVARGAALLMSEGRTFPNLAGTADHANQGFDVIGGGRFLNLPWSVWTLVLVALLGCLSGALHPARPAHLRGRWQ